MAVKNYGQSASSERTELEMDRVILLLFLNLNLLLMSYYRYGSQFLTDMILAKLVELELTNSNESFKRATIA